MTDDIHDINNDIEKVIFEPILNVYKTHLRVSETVLDFYAVLEVVYRKDATLFYLQNLKPSNFLQEKLKPSKFLKYLHLQTEKKRKVTHKQSAECILML